MTTTRFLPKGAKARLGKGMPLRITYSPDGAQIAVTSSTGIWLYDAHSGEALNLLTGHTASAFSVTYSPDGSTLASGGYDNTVRLWDAATGELKNTLTGHTSSIMSVAYSPNGNTLAIYINKKGGLPFTVYSLSRSISFGINTPLY